MIQGTMSGVGKSLLAAALCRIFHEDGIRVAPFKSQNMALNSFVTRDGLEMGRAQAVQARAAGIEPDVRMNPILLKPSSDTGSQVILMGKAIGQYPARDYFRMKRSLIPDIMGAYRSLAGEYDLIVIEGAGSPAEINLKKDDIVNMGLAGMLDAPVILAGDIDRGGVFAQLYGTMALLEESEKKRVIGTVINKFRGDVSLLRTGLDELMRLTGVPVLGVVPYLPVDLDEEDSLSDRWNSPRGSGPIDAAVIRLPRISNYTDFEPLKLHPAISVRYVSRTWELGRPDLVILPGTKNTMGDLIWLKESGLAAKILDLSGAGVPVLGICGGYQMLGTKLSDPLFAEHGGEMEGLGLLPVRTSFSNEKTLKQTEGTALAPAFRGARVTGYEIHMGLSTRSGGEPFFLLGDGTRDGAGLGNVYGTYLHGLFDSGELTDRLAQMLLEQKGMSAGNSENVRNGESAGNGENARNGENAGNSENVRNGESAGNGENVRNGEGAARKYRNYREYEERQLDILAEAVRRSLDLEAVLSAAMR